MSRHYLWLTVAPSKYLGFLIKPQIGKFEDTKIITIGPFAIKIRLNITTQKYNFKIVALICS